MPRTEPKSRKQVASLLPTKAEIVESTCQMLTEVVRSLSSRPDCVIGTVLQEGATSVIMITVLADDLQRVTGNHGRTARSLRAVAGAIAQRYRLHLELDIQANGQGHTGCI